jgi:hypothetical protein
LARFGVDVVSPLTNPPEAIYQTCLMMMRQYKKHNYLREMKNTPQLFQWQTYMTCVRTFQSFIWTLAYQNELALF